MRAWGFAIAAVAFACGSAPAPSSGVVPPDASCATVEKNPYGACYPQGEYGATAGDTIANFCFAPSNACLAQFYDPDGRLGIKLIHVVVAAMWSEPSSAETDFITGSNATGTNPNGASWASELAPDGVVFFEALDDGPTLGTAASAADLATWTSAHDATIDVVLDPGNENLGIFFDSAAVPVNVDIDARTMKVVDASVGFDVKLDASIEAVLASL
jgi:hypothetical protein